MKDGLFLPSTEHILTYCETPFFTSCAYYQESLQLQRIEDSLTGQGRNRRRYLRTPFRSYVSFSTKAESKYKGVVQDEAAWSVDLSPGGIRLETRVQLPILSELTIFFKDQHNSAVCNGKVVWAKPFKETPFFYYGVAFTDADSCRQVNPCLRRVIV